MLFRSGSSIGTALIGSILIGALAAAISVRTANNPEISDAVHKQIGIKLEAGISFVPASDVEQGLKDAHVAPRQVDALVSDYQASQLSGLKAALLAAAAIALGSLLFTENLPTASAGSTPGERSPPEPAQSPLDSSLSGDASADRRRTI